jgi:hypothetical protein
MPTKEAKPQRRPVAFPNRYDLLGLVGTAVLLGGVYLVSLAAALIVAGAMLLAMALMGARRPGS